MEDMKPIEHVLLHPILCAHANTVILFIIEHIEVADEFITSKYPD